MRPTNWISSHEDALLKAVALAATPLLVLLVLLKFAPDISTAVVQKTPPVLADYDFYWQAYTVEVFTPRFAGMRLVYGLAKGIERLTGVPADPRLHPLRLAAFVVATLSIWGGALAVLLDRTGRWNWRTFYAGHLALCLMSLYVYAPWDLPAYGFVAAALPAILRKQLIWAMVLLLVGGLFRESMLHIAWFAVATLIFPALSVGIGWAAAYLVAFFAEWKLIRVWFPTPARFGDWSVWPNLTSMTAWASAGLLLCVAALAGIVLAGRLARRGKSDNSGAQLDRFFLLQVAMVPIWMLFYMANSGNWSEFRLFLPVALPLVYALSAKGSAEAGLR
jgi:hypothetical protein